MAETITPAAAQAAQNVLDCSAVVTVKLSVLGVRRKIAIEEVPATGANAEFLHFSKDILQCKELDDVKAKCGEIRAFLQNRCVPAIFRAGMYRIRDTAVTDIDNNLMRLKDEFNQLVEIFYTKYEDAKAAAPEKLGPLYHEEEYPPLEKVKRAFYMDIKWIEYGTIGKFREMHPTIWQRSVDEMQASVASAGEIMQQLLCAKMIKFMEDTVNRLAVEEDGKKKIFRNDSITKITEVLEQFSQQNVTNNTQLETLIAQAKALMDGVSPEFLRTDDIMRERLRVGFEGMKDTLSTMIVDAPERHIDIANLD